MKVREGNVFSRVCPSVILSIHTLQEHQKVVTDLTLSKVSDMFLQWWSMRNCILKYLSEIKEYGSKLILQKNIIK